MVAESINYKVLTLHDSSVVIMFDSVVAGYSVVSA